MKRMTRPRRLLALLIGVGVLLLTDQLSTLARVFSRWFPVLTRVG